MCDLLFLSRTTFKKAHHQLMKSILVLMTCHNRAKLTENAIIAASTSAKFADVSLFWAVTDDGSTDETSKVVQKNCKDYVLDRKNGDLYWTRGMKNSWEISKQIGRSWDFVMWLNDDVQLKNNAIQSLLSEFVNKEVDIVSGHCSDNSQESSTSYGGFKLRGKRPTRYIRTAPEGKLTQIDTFNGNVVMMRFEVAQIVSFGNFSHMYGDIDFGLKAKSLGLGLFSSRDFVGICPRNSSDFPWLNKTLSRRDSLSIFFGPKGLVFRDHVTFHITHCGYLNGFILASASYARAISKVLIH